MGVKASVSITSWGEVGEGGGRGGSRSRIYSCNVRAPEDLLAPCLFGKLAVGETTESLRGKRRGGGPN